MKDEGCCGPEEEGRLATEERRFSVEAVATVDERGQMVIPKAIRDRMGLRAGDKLAISVMENDGRPCCLNLIRTEELAQRVREILGPAADEIL
jgi:AbrB family looped-hinge helix DNA binding protein